MSTTPRLAELVAASAELAVLTDGPYAGAWYWRADLEAQQAAARHVHARGGTAVLGDKAHYQPTNTWREHPKPEEQARGVHGRGWTYQPPHDPPSDPSATAAAAPTPVADCAECGQRLLLIRPGRTRCQRRRLPTQDRDQRAQAETAGIPTPRHTEPTQEEVSH